ncbi:MAG TPA: TRC40/GET3/ArsA family transport-energizing ATPase [candidate division Zixibacteria bacterium]|nr:TRC40/GET3/ArsA family transport-energizing ATPase [candidate division Zixibacteria bacterium]
MTRILLYTGKGGVGKTSVAAATALTCAQRGYRTIVMSTDIAHSLGDAFGEELGPEPRQIHPNLWAQESEVFHNVAKYWGRIQEYAVSVLRWRGLDDVLAEEMTVLPGMDEVGSLLWIAEHHDSGDYDVIVVDAAPTGETLRLLSLPEAAKWWMEKIEPIGRRITKLTGPLIQRVVGMPMPGDDVFNAGEDLFRRLDHMHELLADPERTSVRVVLTLEQVVIKEAQRSFTYFHLYDYPTDLVVANRILPDEVGPYFRGWYEAQQRYGPMVEHTFAPIPVRYAPFFDQEVVGAEMLTKLGRALYGDLDPTTHFYRGRPYHVVRDDGEYVLSVELPFASKERISLSRHADEIVIDVGSWRRNLVLPRILVEAQTRGARFDDKVLKIRFAAPERTSAAGVGSRGGGRHG